MDRLNLIQIETTTACQAKCGFCPTSDHERYFTRPLGNMRQEVFEKVVREGIEMGVKHFAPFLNGEPLIDRQFFDRMAYLRDRDITVSISTNVALLTKKKADVLAQYTNIDLLTLSFHGGDKESYERVMGLNYENARANAEYMISIAPFPVRVYMLRHEANLGSEVSFLKTWGINSFISDAFFNWAGTIESERAKQFLKPQQPCGRVLGHLVVLWDGRVALCCMDHDGQVILGDVTQETLQVIWERNQGMRDRHKRRDFDMPLCKDCNMNRYL